MIGDAAVTDTEYHHLIYFCFRRIVSDSKVLRQSYIIHTTTLEACRARFCELCILVNGIASSLTFRVYILWTYHRFGSVTAQNQPTHAFCLSFAMFLQQSYDHMVRVCSCFGRATRPTNRRLPRTSSNFSWVARKKRTTAWRSTANTSTQPSTNSPLTSWRAKDSTSKSRIPAVFKPCGTSWMFTSVAVTRSSTRTCCAWRTSCCTRKNCKSKVWRRSWKERRIC